MPPPGPASGAGPAAAPGAASPKDRFITVYGRNPVLEVLADQSLDVFQVILADNARGPAAEEITAAATRRGVPVRRATAQRVKVLAGNGKQDQGVLADVIGGATGDALREAAAHAFDSGVSVTALLGAALVVLAGVIAASTLGGTRKNP